MSAIDARSRRIADWPWRSLAPALILCLVAFGQIGLARWTELSPWKGGGFGMFATTDGTAARRVRLFVEAPGRSEEVEVRPSMEEAAARARLFPTRWLTRHLAKAVVARERRHGRPVSTVRVQVWRIRYAPGTLLAHDALLHEDTFRVDPLDRVD
jgi:hypothetical protein